MEVEGAEIAPGERELILANFQSITNIENVEECLLYLNGANWNLDEAVKNGMPGGHEHASGQHSPPVEANENPFAPLVEPIPPSYPQRRRVRQISDQSDEDEMNWIRPPVTSDDPENLAKVYQLRVTVSKDAGTEIRHLLPTDGSKTVREVKNILHSLSGIPPSRQIWRGWPKGTEDDRSVIAFCKLDEPLHDFTVTAKSIQPTAANSASDDGEHSDVEVESPDHSISNVSVEDFSVYPDRDGAALSNSDRLPLIPGDCSSPQEATENLIRVFESRYGFCHPLFYVGSLAEILQDAHRSTPRERRPILLYLHHDASISANVFCTEVLCKEQLVAFTSENFVSWAWDMTLAENKEKFLRWCTEYFGPQHSHILKAVTVDQFPVLAVVVRHHGTYDVVKLVSGVSSLDVVMAELLTAVEIFKQLNSVEVAEELERFNRESVRNEQEEAYQQSLVADREKEDRKKAEELEKRAKELEKENLAKQLEADRLAAEKSLSPEPSAATPGVITVRIQKPNGTATRRFLPTDFLKLLFTFVRSLGYVKGNYRLLAAYPTRDLTSLNENETLGSYNFTPRETLRLEDRSEEDGDH